MRVGRQKLEARPHRRVIDTYRRQDHTLKFKRGTASGRVIVRSEVPSLIRGARNALGRQDN